MQINSCAYNCNKEVIIKPTFLGAQNDPALCFIHCFSIYSEPIPNVMISNYKILTTRQNKTHLLVELDSVDLQVFPSVI